MPEVYPFSCSSNNLTLCTAAPPPKDTPCDTITESHYIQD